jgi:CheY-like chemotaxis protein
MAVVSSESTSYILAIEDNHSLLRLLREMLEFRDYQVATAQSGREALQILRSSTRLPDVIVSDFNLLDMNAFDLLDSLAELNETRHIPFIILSGETELPAAHDRWMTQVAAHVPKPFTLSLLHSAIDRVLLAC